MGPRSLLPSGRPWTNGWPFSAICQIPPAVVSRLRLPPRARSNSLSLDLDVLGLVLVPNPRVDKDNLSIFDLDAEKCNPGGWTKAVQP